MKKISLNEFIQSVNLEFIQDPELILGIVRKMWSIPFEEVFHVKCRYMDPTPWEYIYEEFAEQESLLPAGREAYLLCLWRRNCAQQKLIGIIMQGHFRAFGA